MLHLAHKIPERSKLGPQHLRHPAPHRRRRARARHGELQRLVAGAGVSPRVARQRQRQRERRIGNLRVDGLARGSETLAAALQFVAELVLGTGLSFGRRHAQHVVQEAQLQRLPCGKSLAAVGEHRHGPFSIRQVEQLRIEAVDAARVRDDAPSAVRLLRPTEAVQPVGPVLLRRAVIIQRKRREEFLLVVLPERQRAVHNGMQVGCYVAD